MGSRLADWILKNTNHKVIGIDNLSGGYVDNVPEGVTFYKKDLVTDVDDINPYTLECIRYFLEHYKDGEKNKFIQLGETYGREEALLVIYDSEI